MCSLSPPELSPLELLPELSPSSPHPAIASNIATATSRAALRIAASWLLALAGLFQQFPGRSRGIRFAPHDAFQQPLPLRVAPGSLLQPAAESDRREPQHLGAEVARAALVQRPRVLDVPAVG